MMVAHPPGEGVVLLALPLMWSLARVVCVGPCWCGVLCSICPERKFAMCSPAIVAGSDDDVAIMGVIGVRGSGPCTSSKGRPPRLVGLAGQLFELTCFCLGVWGPKMLISAFILPWTPTTCDMLAGPYLLCSVFASPPELPRLVLWSTVLVYFLFHPVHLPKPVLRTRSQGFPLCCHGIVMVPILDKARAW